MNSNGWIKLHRGILDWEWWDNRNVRDLFIYCLLEASHEDVKWQGESVPRGSFVTSLRKLAKGTGLTVQQTRSALCNILTTHEITCQATQQNTLITVCNYDRYQLSAEDEQHTNQHKVQNENNTQITHFKEIPPTPPIKNKQEIKEEEEEKKARVIYKKEGSENLDIDTLYTEYRDELLQEGSTNGIFLMRQTGKDMDTVLEYLDGYQGTLRNACEYNRTRGLYRHNFLKYAKAQSDRDQRTPGKTQEQSPNVSLGVGEYINEQGQRTYGDGKHIVPMDAPKRLFSQEVWDSTNQRWIVI